jgi:hypothetical protein
MNLEKSLRQLTKKNELLVADVEFFRNKVIGIDRRNKKLVYVEYGKGIIDQFCIDLNSLSFCKIKRGVDKFSNRVTDISVEVKCKGINKIYRLNFYNSSFDKMRLKTSSLKKAEQWKTKINLNRRSVSFDTQFEYVL